MSENQNNQIVKVLRALLSDIESMYEGAESLGRQPEEFFGPFSVWKLDDADVEARISVSWPNLAISLHNAKNVLRSADSGLVA